MSSRKIIVGLLAAGLVTATTVITASTKGSEPRPVTVHEWGTFTTVHTSEGRQLSGLHLDEEPLPGFVQNVAPVDNSHPMLFSKMGQYQAQFVKPVRNPAEIGVDALDHARVYRVVLDRLVDTCVVDLHVLVAVRAAFGDGVLADLVTVLV